MKFFWKMPNGLKATFFAEIEKSANLIQKNDFTSAWRHLERAHIIGQPWAVEHTYSHWKMLIFAIKIKNTKEIIGQLPRLFVGGIKSYVGKIPTGNTGGANVPPLKKMQIPEDILQVMNPYYSIENQIS